MTAAAKEFQIKRRLNYEEVNWQAVRELLCDRFKLTQSESDINLQNFFNRFLEPFAIYWYRNIDLSSADNQILAAVCEVHGADSVTLEHRRAVHAGPVCLDYAHEIEFWPLLGSARPGNENGICRAVVKFRVIGKSFQLETLSQAILLRSLFSLLAATTYFVALGCFVYSIAVFFAFLHKPAEMTIATTNNFSVGLAALCFLVGAAGICGRAISNIIKLVINRVTGRTYRYIP